MIEKKYEPRVGDEVIVNTDTKTHPLVCAYVTGRVEKLIGQTAEVMTSDGPIKFHISRLQSAEGL